MDRPLSPQVVAAIEGYCAGAFPMDDDGAAEIPWYVVEQRAVLSLEAPARERLRRRVRRDLRRCEGLRLAVDEGYDEVLARCAEPPPGEDGRWITDRLTALYRELHAAGVSHSFELWTPDDRLAAGILGVTMGSVALLESMRRVLPGAGNALLSRTLDLLAERGFTLCDIQMPTPHTERLGCELLPRAEFERRLAAALSRRG